MKRKIKQKIKETLALPAEVIMDSPKIVLEANYNVWIENYIGIIEYSDKEVKVNTADFIVKITGEKPAYGFCHKRGFEYFGKNYFGGLRVRCAFCL